MRAGLFFIIAAVAIATYLGLAVYVITQNPRRLISWVFGGFCLVFAGFYFGSLFLFPEAAGENDQTPAALRWRVAAACFAPTLYLHLVSYYFPIGWRKRRRWILIPAYLASLALAWAGLTGNLLIAGPRRLADDVILGLQPGPLMIAFAVLFLLLVSSGLAGLINGYRAALTASLRSQIRYLFVPTALLILGGFVNWFIVLTGRTDWLLPEIGDAMLILAAFFFANTILRYGSFIGTTLAWRNLFYATLGAVLFMATLNITLLLDLRLMRLTPFPLPAITSAYVLALIAGFPAIQRRVIPWIDQAFFRTARQEDEIADRLVQSLLETPGPQDLVAELLDTLCTLMGARGGYLAWPDANTPPGSLTVQWVCGEIAIQRGGSVNLPAVDEPGSHTAHALLPHEQEQPGWQDVSLFCILATPRNKPVLIALSARRDGAHYKPEEMARCAVLARQLTAAVHIMELKEERNQHLTTARDRERELMQLQREVIATANQTLRAWDQTRPPLEIRLLGPLQVLVNGQIPAASAWGSERTRVLLAYLLWKGANGASRDEILEVLWPGRPPSEAANNFHVALYRLRRLLEPGLNQGNLSRYIIHDGGRYRFNYGSAHWLDTSVFKFLVESQRPADLRRAVELYRGAYLEDTIFQMPPEAVADVLAMEKLYLNALQQLVAQVEDPHEKMIYLEKMLAIEPADFAARRQLVAVCMELGRPDLARRQVTAWQEAVQQMGLEPDVQDLQTWLRVDRISGSN